MKTKLFVLLAACLFGQVAVANEVTKNTDVRIRKAQKHYQVTKCDPDKTKCEVYEVTHFNSSFNLEEGKDHFAKCHFTVKGTKRFMTCNMIDNGPRIVEVPVVQVKERVVVKKEIVRVPVPAKPYRNRLSLQVGYGPLLVQEESDNDSTNVKLTRGPLVGLSYQRLVTSNLSLGVTAVSNGSIMLSGGFDF